MILAGQEIFSLLKQGIIENSGKEFINASSLDVTLGSTIFYEERVEQMAEENYLSLRDREKPMLSKFEFGKDGEVFTMYPNQFILAHTEQIFHLPRTVSARYSTKSSMGRMGLEHMNAGWCDAEWNNSSLTLELKNMLQHHCIQLRKGDRIGQMVFYAHVPVHPDFSYKVHGNYNNDRTVSPAKFKG